MLIKREISANRSAQKNLSQSRIAIITSMFNKEISENLIFGCEQGFKKNRFSLKNLDFFNVPGAFEIPLTAKKIAENGRYHLIMAFGAVIEGQTDHYRNVSTQCVRGIMDVQLKTGIPIIFEVLCVKKKAHALARSSRQNLKHNKGYQAALTAIEYLKTLGQI